MKAIEYFEKALDLYEKAQKQVPERAEEIEDILSDIQQSLFWCKKRQTLG